MTTTTPAGRASVPAGPTDPVPPVDPGALVALIEAETGSVLAAMDWAEDEIAGASGRHRAQADVLFHAFGVLVPRHIGPGMNTKFVYRGHIRELLERVKRALLRLMQQYVATS